jgi:hypothetical protein
LQFVVDGAWVTDNHAREENDGQNNINNVLYPEDIKQTSHPETGFASVTGGNTAAAVMAGVTPESTTAALAKDAPLENSGVPGGFPDTPANETGELSVNPIPASNGLGNPIKLNPGDPVPEPSAVHSNTVASTIRTDKAGYEADASNPVIPGNETTKVADALEVPPVPKSGLVPESSLPLNAPATDTTDPGVTIQSAAPVSSTAALAAQVPLESEKAANGAAPSSEVPDVVKESISKAHKDPEAAANVEAVEEKKQVEQELQSKVGLAGGAGTPDAPASDVPDVVKESIKEAHKDPEAAANREAVEEKKEVEHELQKKVPETQATGEHAPTVTAAATTTAPAASATVDKPVDSTSVSPRTTTPAPARQSQPAVTTGVESGTAPKVSQPVGGTAQDNSKDKKKKRASGFFNKLKEKFK